MALRFVVAPAMAGALCFAAGLYLPSQLPRLQRASSAPRADFAPTGSVNNPMRSEGKSAGSPGASAPAAADAGPRARSGVPPAAVAAAAGAPAAADSPPPPGAGGPAGALPTDPTAEPSPPAVAIAPAGGTPTDTGNPTPTTADATPGAAPAGSAAAELSSPSSAGLPAPTPPADAATPAATLVRAVDAPPAAAGSGPVGGAGSPPVPTSADATAAFAVPAGAQAGDASVGGKTQLAYAEPAPESAKPEASAPATALPSESGLPMPATPPAPRVDTAGLDQIIALYRKGDLAGGDALAETRTDPLVHTTLEWLALRTNPHDAGYQRIMDFLAAHRDWPGAAWLRRHAEEALFFDKRDASVVAAFFGDSKPIGPLGQLAEARVLLKDGRQAEAAAIVREVWRDNDLGLPAESAILREFAGLLTAADHKFRADRLIYEESTTAALRAAERAGTDVAQLARARAAAVNASATAGALLDAVPVALRKDPGYQFARIQLLRRAGRTLEAAAMLLAAPREPELIVDGDAWWNERRWIARKLLDLGDAETAYRLCAEHSAVSPEAKVEAEFHAGWIALRYLDDPARASTHFARAAAAANGPDTKARAAYWQGRAAEASGDRDGAMRFYAAAAAYPANYYGQLANAKLPAEDVPVRRTPTAAIDDDRHEAVKVIELLYALGQPDLAMPLIIDAVQNLSDETQVAAVGAVVSAYHDARATLLVGKFAANRGLALDQFAFPIFGIPAFEPVANSADRAVIYAIARQESAFEPRAVSGAGAKGLMQLLSSTARRTAQRFGIAYDEARLTSDAAFNAKLGAAFLGALFGEQRGSYILTFAAYNAGGKRVQEWINAYGDPLNPAIDPVDWIELIPIDETRHYVQLIMENLEMYRLRFGDRSALLIDADLRRSGSGS